MAHDTVPYFMERFRDAYTTQLQNFAQNVLQDRPPPITIDDGLEALRIGVAATRAHETGRASPSRTSRSEWDPSQHRALARRGNEIVAAPSFSSVWEWDLRSTEL